MSDDAVSLYRLQQCQLCVRLEITDLVLDLPDHLDTLRVELQLSVYVQVVRHLTLSVSHQHHLVLRYHILQVNAGRMPHEESHLRFVVYGLDVNLSVDLPVARIAHHVIVLRVLVRLSPPMSVD